MKKKKLPRQRNSVAGVLALTCFRKQVVRDRTIYTRKGRAVYKQFVDGSFSISVI